MFIGSFYPFFGGFEQIYLIIVIGMAGERKVGFINKRNLHQSLSTLPHQYPEVQVRGRMSVIITETLDGPSISPKGSWLPNDLGTVPDLILISSHLCASYNRSAIAVHGMSIPTQTTD